MNQGTAQLQAFETADRVEDPSLADVARRLAAEYASGELFADLVNAPSPHPFQKAPVLLRASQRGGVPLGDAVYTIVMPVFEQRHNLSRNLQLIEQNATLPHDWVFIDDGSGDGSSEVIEKFIEGESRLVRSAVLVRNDAPIFETASDNLGFKLARTEIVIEIQADLQILESGFDAMLVGALKIFPRASAVSGRAGHCFVLKPQSRLGRLLGLKDRTSVGLMGTLVEQPDIDPLRGFVYECETVNRGPWALRRADLLRHGFLDQANFFLGDDDHDFHRRLLQAEGRSPIYVPMHVRSKLDEGSTRRPRSALNAEVYAFLQANRQGSQEFTSFMAKPRRPRPVRRLSLPSGVT